MLISEEYRAEQKRLHETTDYGTASGIYAPLVFQIISKLDITELLDYGCGSKIGLLKAIAPHLKIKGMNLRYQAYDPAVEEYSGEPVPSQMVACIDVLEHIEPEFLDDVLDELERLTEEVGFFTVTCLPAKKQLSDGRNAHLIQQPPAWWLDRIVPRWDLQTFQRTKSGFYVIVNRKEKLIHGA